MNQLTGLDRFVTKLRLRSKLSREEAEALLQLRAREQKIKARTVIVQPRERVEVCCLVIEGSLSRFDDLGGRRQVTAMHIPGDMCDLHSILAPRAASGIEALTSSTVLLVPHDQLRDVAKRYPTVSFAFWRDTIADASINAKWISTLSGFGATRRLAHLICELGLRLEKAGLGTRTQFRLPIKQLRLAEILGITEVRISECVKELRSLGLIQKHNSEVFLPDFDALAKFANFNSAYLLFDDKSAAPAVEHRADPLRTER